MNPLLLLLLLMALSMSCSCLAADPPPVMDMATMLMYTMQPAEYFDSKGADDDCSSVPPKTRMGVPCQEVCMQSVSLESKCVCVRRSQPLLDIDLKFGFKQNPVSGFVNECGKCYDPCALKFAPGFFATMNASAVVPFATQHMSIHDPTPFFFANGPNDNCANVPDVMAGINPMLEACTASKPFDTVCVCAKLVPECVALMAKFGLEAPLDANGRTVMCGTCYPPCTFKYHPEPAVNGLAMM